MVVVFVSLVVLHFDPAFFMATEDREGILDAAVLAAALRGGVADLGRDVPAPDVAPSPAADRAVDCGGASPVGEGPMIPGCMGGLPTLATSSSMSISASIFPSRDIGAAMDKFRSCNVQKSKCAACNA